MRFVFFPTVREDKSSMIVRGNSHLAAMRGQIGEVLVGGGEIVIFVLPELVVTHFTMATQIDLYGALFGIDQHSILCTISLQKTWCSPHCAIILLSLSGLRKAL
ncbi:hypothetical protein J6590_075225 [Homalodisca vitripennis]|nr:hypothetical protein J6590_075225 [Homalodisca vitripennis]